MQKFSLHTHTTFSDGNHTLEEMVRQAVRLGFETFGISDHLVVHKNITQTPCWDEIACCGGRPSFDDMIDLCHKHAEEIRKAGKKYGIKTLVGYEVDYFTYSGWDDEFRDFLGKIDYDYLINGNHFLSSDDGEKVFDIWRFGHLCQFAPEPAEVYLKRHFETMEKAVRSKLFLFLAHIDYAQKVKSYCENNHLHAIENIVKALKETGTGCEISTKGIRKFGHFYPSENILQALVAADIPLVISDDAHHKDELGFYFNEAEEELKKISCKKRIMV